jgi:DNA-binding transcriptional LysR family regulator
MRIDQGAGMDSHLRTAMAVRKHMSFTKAAEELFLSRPAVSQQIQIFESELGFELFERRGRNLKATDTGEIFLRKVEPLLDLYEAELLNARLANNEVVRTLTVGCSSTFTDFWIEEAVRRYCALHPDMQFVLTQDKTSYLPKLLYQKRADAVLVLEADLGKMKDVLTVKIETTGCCAYVSGDHRLAQRSSVTKLELEGETIILPKSANNASRLHRLAREVVRAGMQWSRCMTTDCGETGILMARSGLGVWVGLEAERHYARNFGLVPLHISDLDPMDIGIIIAYVDEASPHVAQFASIAQETMLRRHRELDELEG